MSFSTERFEEFLLASGVIGFSDPSLVLKSGKESFWYANLRKVSQSYNLLAKLASIVTDFLQEKKLPLTDGVIGVPEGASLLGYEVQKKLIEKKIFEDKIFHFRNKPKQHGNPSDKYWVNGNLPKSLILLEDVSTTGSSLIGFAQNLHSMEIKTPLVVGLLNREQLNHKGQSLPQILESFGIKYHFLTTASKVLPLALAKEKRKQFFYEKVALEYQKEYQQFGLSSPLFI